MVEDKPLVFPPGSQYALLELGQHRRRTDDRGGDWQGVRRRSGREVFGPLGLDDTSLPAGTELPDPSPRLRLADDGTPEDLSNSSPPDMWASGGIVVHTRRSERLHPRLRRRPAVRRRHRADQQELPSPAGSARGPGDNSASMALFRYDTACGAVYGHPGTSSATPSSLSLRLTADARRRRRSRCSARQPKAKQPVSSTRSRASSKRPSATPSRMSHP